MLGKLLDRRYQVVQVLGRGAFGQTYIALDTRRPGQPKCVVKHLKPAKNTPERLETARRLFLSEAETLEELGNHDQVPRLLAYFEEEDDFFLVQEFIDGQPLKVELAGGQAWAENQVVQLLRDVLNVLQFVHSRRVIHRDIKPDNLMRRQRDSRLVLIDFGAVKQIQTQITSSSGDVTIAIGTPGYMPIEQGYGMPRPSSDLYALGIIGIQALTGVHPTRLERDAQTGEIRWQHRAQVSPELAAILTRLVRYHFKDRFRAASEAMQALRPLLERYPSPKPNLKPEPSWQPAAESPPPPAPPANPHLIISAEHYARLEQSLTALIGPVAPLLLRQASTQTPGLRELVESLASHLSGRQRLEFERQAVAMLEETRPRPPLPAVRTEAMLAPPKPSRPTLDENFIRRCEQGLAEAIGPIAAYLVREAVHAQPQRSAAELVAVLAMEIPDRQKAAEFQRRLLA